MNLIISNTVMSYRNALYVGDYQTGLATETNNDLIYSIAGELSKHGYGLAPSLIAKLKTFSAKGLRDFYNQARAAVTAKLGSNVRYAPLFRKFPDETPNRSVIVETVATAIGPYAYVLFYSVYGFWSSDDYNGSWFGRQFPGVVLEESIKRPDLVRNKPLNLLEAADDSVVFEVFQNLVSANGSLSESDKDFVKAVIVHKNGIAALPESIPNKENMAFAIAAASARSGMTAELRKTFGPYVKTATDVLRLAAAFSGSDVALAEHSRFKLSNSQRKFLMESLDRLNHHTAVEDMMRFYSLWLVLAKYLHINAYADTYPQAAGMARAIRNDKSFKVSTFNRSVESKLLYDDFNQGRNLISLTELLRTRPGDFARRLDHVLRLVPKLSQVNVANAFLSVADQVATPLLLNLATHFVYRNTAAPVRVHLPKGSTANAIIERTDERDTLPYEVTQVLETGINKILTERFAKLDSLGKVYIDPQIADILVPTSMRNISESLHTVARGSKLRIDPETKVLRMFLYWEDIKDESYFGGRVDVDLSALHVDANFIPKGQIAYYALRNGAMTHSGDFTSAPNGAAEFIDIDLAKFRKELPDSRYVGITVNSFTGQSFDKFTAKAGFMSRDGKTGKTFEARTVEQKFDLTSASKFAVPMVIDLETYEVIWLDMGIRDTALYATNLNSKAGDVGDLIKYAVNLYRDKATLFDLLTLHVNARAESVSDVFDPDETYDHVFDMKFATRVDEIMSKYLA